MDALKKLREGMKIEYKDPAIDKAMKEAAAAQAEAEQGEEAQQ